MNCMEFQRQLEAAIDSRESPDRSLRSHGETCSDCRQAWQDYQLLNQALAGWSKRLPEVDLVDRVIADVRAADPQRIVEVPVHKRRSAGRSIDRRRYSMVAVVAAVLIGVTVVLTNQPQPGVGVVKQEPDDSPEQVADVRHLIADARSAWLGFASRAAHQANDFRVFVPDLTSDLGLESKDEDAPPASEDEANPPDGVDKAFDFLFEASGFEEAQTT